MKQIGSYCIFEEGDVYGYIGCTIRDKKLVLTESILSTDKVLSQIDGALSHAAYDTTKISYRICEVTKILRGYTIVRDASNRDYRLNAVGKFKWGDQVIVPQIPLRIGDTVVCTVIDVVRGKVPSGLKDTVRYGAAFSQFYYVRSPRNNIVKWFYLTGADLAESWTDPNGTVLLEQSHIMPSSDQRCNRFTQITKIMGEIDKNFEAFHSPINDEKPAPSKLVSASLPAKLIDTALIKCIADNMLLLMDNNTPSMDVTSIDGKTIYMAAAKKLNAKRALYLAKQYENITCLDAKYLELITRAIRAGKAGITLKPVQPAQPEQEKAAEPIQQKEEQPVNKKTRAPKIYADVPVLNNAELKNILVPLGNGNTGSLVYAETEYGIRYSKSQITALIGAEIMQLGHHFPTDGSAVKIRNRMFVSWELLKKRLLRSRKFNTNSTIRALAALDAPVVERFQSTEAPKKMMQQEPRETSIPTKIEMLTDWSDLRKMQERAKTKESPADVLDRQLLEHAAKLQEMKQATEPDFNALMRWAKENKCSISFKFEA